MSWTEERIAALYSTLASSHGPQHWWPANSRFEVIVGAYLTQNTSWRNVELALASMRAAQVLTVDSVREISLRRLEILIRSSGFFREKARRLKAFVEFLDRCYGGSLTRMFRQPTARLRRELLSLDGVGPETADAILLYAGQHPVFVVDSYTRRLAARHGILPADAGYEEVRTRFERALRRVRPVGPAGADALATSPGFAAHRPSRMSRARRSPLAQVFNEMHGLVVAVGKQYCLKSRARCERCPLAPLLPDGERKDALRAPKV